MRKLVYILLIAAAMIVGACEGPVGPMGPEGPAGGDFIGTTFEFTGNFTAANGYELLFNFRDNGFDPYESDVILPAKCAEFYQAISHRPYLPLRQGTTPAL